MRGSRLRVYLLLIYIQLPFHRPLACSRPLLCDLVKSVPDIGFFAWQSTSPSFPPPIDVSQCRAAQHSKWQSRCCFG